jgi:hypothetical protein
MMVAARINKVPAHPTTIPAQTNKTYFGRRISHVRFRQRRLVYGTRGLGGHFVVVRGYNATTGKYVLNDPYGQWIQTPYQWGAYDGANAQMFWSDLGIKEMISYGY